MRLKIHLEREPSTIIPSVETSTVTLGWPVLMFLSYINKISSCQIDQYRKLTPRTKQKCTHQWFVGRWFLCRCCCFRWHCAVPASLSRVNRLQQACKAFPGPLGRWPWAKASLITIKHDHSPPVNPISSDQRHRCSRLHAHVGKSSSECFPVHWFAHSLSDSQCPNYSSISSCAMMRLHNFVGISTSLVQIEFVNSQKHWSYQFKTMNGQQLFIKHNLFRNILTDSRLWWSLLVDNG